MMDRTFQLQWSLLKAVIAHTVRNFHLHKNQANIRQRLCRRNVVINVFKSKFQLRQQRTPACEHLIRPLTIPKRSTTLSISNGTTLLQSNRHIADVFRRQWDVFKYQCLSIKTVSRIQGICRNASSESSAPSHLNDGMISEISSGEENMDGKEKTIERMSYLEARKQGLLPGRRSLSPTERVDRMLVADVVNIRLSTGKGAGEDIPTQVIPSLRASEDGGQSSDNVSPMTVLTISSRGVEGGGIVRDNHPSFQEDPPMVDGEMVIAVRENFKRHEYLYRMFPLNASNAFRSKYGTISHTDIVGHPAGRTFGTDLGIDIMIRRPTLDEFVLYMKRTPVISYPKDCCTMLMMIDASPGDVILEAGTGSGAMTLFLSRAVGQAGCIHTFEAKPEHLKRAIKNVRQWASSWNISHPRLHWPENVCFHSGKLERCDKALDRSLLVDGAVIDMERPHVAMAILAARLKSGKAAVIYVANITQIIEVAEYLRIHSLPLTIEKTLEVAHKQWVVNQARRHSGRSLGEARLTSDSEKHSDESDSECEYSSSSIQYIKDNVPKYIARPHNQQHGHTAFLVKIRKIGSASSTYKI